MNAAPPDAASMAAAVAYAAGIRTLGDLRIAVAIGGPESGWNPTAVGDEDLEDSTWGPSVGIWQIRSLRDQTNTGQARDVTRLKDPAFNARAMYEISGGGSNWRPWTGYTSGAYRQYLDAGETAARWAIANMSTDAGLTGVMGNLASVVGSAGDIPGKVADAAVSMSGLGPLVALGEKLTAALPTIANPKMWLRGGLISAGAVLVVVGLNQFIRPELGTMAKAAVAL